MQIKIVLGYDEAEVDKVAETLADAGIVEVLDGYPVL